MRVALFLLVLGAFAPSAAAQPESDADVFEINPSIDYPLLGAGLALFLLPPLLEPEFPADYCSPCDRSKVNVFDRQVIGYHSEFADVASDVLGAVIPAGALAMSYVFDRDSSRMVAEDLLLIVESVVLSGTINQITRHAYVRPRPYMYLEPVPDYRRNNAEDWHAFFSGHTSAAFAAATSFARIQSLRRPHSKWKNWIWLGAMSAASLMPVMRVASGEHFPTDVFTGAAVGIASGFLVPALHERKKLGQGPQLVVGRGFYGLRSAW